MTALFGSPPASLSFHFFADSSNLPTSPSMFESLRLSPDVPGRQAVIPPWAPPASPVPWHAVHPSPAAGVLYLKLRPWNLPALLKTLPEAPLSGTGLQNSFRSGLQLSLQDFSLPVPLGPPGHPAQLLDPGPLGSVPHVALYLLLLLSQQLQHLFLLALLHGCLMARCLVTHTPPHRCPLDSRSTRNVVCICRGRSCPLWLVGTQFRR